MRDRWQVQVNEIEYFKKKNDYTIREVAAHTKRSIGKICQDLKLAAALRVYPRLEEMESYQKALEYVKAKGFERAED
jgi:hypothetical protein